MKKLIQSGDDEITRGDAVTLSMVAQLDDVAESIAGATFVTLFMSPDGQRVVIPDASHDIIEAAGEDVGAFEVDLTAVETALIQPGRHVHFCTTATIGGLPKTFWGTVQVKKKPGE